MGAIRQNAQLYLESVAGPARLSLLPGGLYNTKAQNGVPYAQDSVTTHNGVQYAVWVNADRDPVIGKRVLPFGDWSTFDLSTVSGNPLATPTEDDLHNSYVVAVDTAGYIHVAGNHHDDALRYVKSTSPNSITGWASASMVGTDETSVSYPTFVKMGNGELVFLYRNGSSGNGDIFLNAYSTATGTWTRRNKILQGTSPVSPAESPYLNHVAVDANGVMHLFFVWRETSDVSTTHDICYMKSADRGSTFTSVSGASLTLPVTPSTSPVVLEMDSSSSFTINQCGAAADTNGYPHSAWWMSGSASEYNAQLHHIYWDGDEWINTTLIDKGYYVSPVDMGRPAVVAHGGRVFVIYQLQGAEPRTKIYCRDVTPGADANLPTFVLYDGDLGLYEPSFDTRSVSERDELHMLITPISTDTVTADPDYESQWGGILTLDLSNVEYVARGRQSEKPVAETQSVWLPANAFLATAGSPTLSASPTMPAWYLDTSATEVVATTTIPPTGWETMHIDAWWANDSASSGDIAANCRYSNRVAGNNTTGSETNAGDVVAAAGLQNIIVVTRVVSSVRIRPGYLFKVNFRRTVSNSADTLTNDIAFLGLMLTRAT